MTSNNPKTSTIKQDIKVTAFQDSEYSTPHFSFIQVEFGNKTDDWQDISKTLLNISGDEIKIILGSRLKNWKESIQNKVAVDRHNERMSLALILSLIHI